MTKAVLGIIGGSGIYDLPGLEDVREETIQRVRIVEFKYAQGAKPGLGGHLLGDKNTPPVARMREAVAGTLENPSEIDDEIQFLFTALR